MTEHDDVPPTPGLSEETRSEEAIADGARIRRQAADGVVAFVFRGVTVKAMGFVATLIIARFVTPSELGVLALGTTILTFAQILASGGFAASFIQQEAEPDPDVVAAMQGFQLALTGSIAVVIAAIGLPFGGAGAIAALLATSLPVSILRVPLVVEAQRRLYFDKLARADILENGLTSVLTIVLVVLGLGVWGVAIASVVRAFIGLLVLRLSVGQKLVRPRWNFSQVRPLLAFGASFQALDLSNALRNYGTNVLIAIFSGPATLGFWNLISRVMLIITVLFSSLYRVAFAAMSRLVASGEPIAPIMRRAFGLTGIAIGLLAVPLTGATPALIPVVFGDRWQPVVEAIPWVTGGLLIAGPVSTAATGYLQAVGEIRAIVRNVLVHTAVFFLVMVPLLGPLGVQAAGMGHFAMSAVDVLLLGAVVKRRTGISALAITFPIFLMAAASAAAGWVACGAVGLGVPGLLVGGFVAEAVYLGLLLALRRRVAADLVGVVRRAVAPRLGKLRPNAA